MKADFFPIKFWLFDFFVFWLRNKEKCFSKHNLQSNLWTTTALGTPNLWPLWPLWKGGRCSDVSLCYEDSNWDSKMVVDLQRWRLFRFDCTHKKAFLPPNLKIISQIFYIYLTLCKTNDSTPTIVLPIWSWLDF